MRNIGIDVSRAIIDEGASEEEVILATFTYIDEVKARSLARIEAICMASAVLEFGHLPILSKVRVCCLCGLP
jgi:hypothetical protein